MSEEQAEGVNKTGRAALTSVLLFWVGYVALTLVVGFATASTMSAEVWRLTAWGFISSGALLALSLGNRGMRWPLYGPDSPIRHVIAGGRCRASPRGSRSTGRLATIQ